MNTSPTAVAALLRRSGPHATARRPVSSLGSAALLVLALGSMPAHATLGQNRNSVEADRAQVQASAVRQVSHAAFTVHELTTALNGLVREYVAPNGQVFAVTWHGPAMPNLQQVLGEHYKTITAAPARAPGSRAHVNLNIGNLVFESSGHMRSFHGRAYLTDALPSGVTSHDIQ